MSGIKYWYAVYTKPRWEKKVNRLLSDRHIESYCPLNKVHRQWSDRVKVIEEPLFKSYVFVHIAPEEQSTVRFVNGVLNFVYWLGKPAIIKEEEIELIKQFMLDYKDVKAEALDLKPFDKIIVKRGVMVGQTGNIIRIMHNSAEVILESLGYKLIAKFDKHNLAPFAGSK